MGIYSNNSTYLGSNSFVANEAYATSTGALQLMVECQQNDLALFNAVIGMDFQEAAAYASGDEYMMESVSYLHEASAQGIWQSFINLITKVGAKIKAIFDRFIAKLTAFFTKDTKDLLRKYESKFDSNDFKKMSVKGYKPLKELTNVLDLNTFNELNADNDRFGRESLQEINKNIKKTEYFLYKTINSGEPGSSYTYEKFSEDLEKKMFGPATDSEGAVENQRAEIKNLLRNNKIISNIEKSKKEVLRKLNELKRTAESNLRDIDRVKYDDDPTGEKKGKDTAAANACITELNNASSACTGAFNCYVKYIKKAIAQSKRVFVMAATYTSHNNSVFADALGEVLEEEVINYFDED